MNEEIEKAITHLAARIPDAADSGDSMRLSQSITNLAHALNAIRYRQECEKCGAP